MSAAELAVVSCQRFGCTAAQTPSGIAQLSAIDIDITTINPLAFIFCTCMDAPISASDF